MNPFYKNLSLWLIIIMMVAMLYQLFNSPNLTDEQASYTEFLALVAEERVSEVVIQDQELYVTDSNGRRFKVFAPRDADLIRILRDKNVRITAKPPAEPPWYMSILVSWFPMILLIGVWIFFMRQMQSGGGKAMSFGKSRARLLSDQQEKVTFEDVAGIDEAKEELGEVVEFLREPRKFTRLGGRIPKGVLLTGPPGTGKTLLARAIAGEAGVPFYSISGSDFVEMFVGVGASRVRDLFVQGKKNAPCIIFIDEIDAVGRHRGAGLGGGHDEREQTLNQLLVEMDGFESNEGVILISATNRPDVLDPALLRPGRFDRQVVVNLPDIKGRQGIIEVHIKKTPVGPDVNTRVLARGTPGFSGADLENMVNEAALLAARREKETIGMQDLEDAKDKVYMGLERKSKVMTDDDRKVTAYHEAGHALVARFLPRTDPVNKITIIPRGRALGITWYLPEEKDHMFKDQLESRLAVAFGGRAAEELIFERITTGASGDIKQATDIAQKMIRAWGMSDNLSPISYSNQDEQIFLGREISQHRDYSEATAQKIDEEVSNLIRAAHDRAKTTLQENIDVLHKLTDMLLEKETVQGQELDDLIISMRPGFEFPSKVPEMEEEEGQAEPQPATDTADDGPVAESDKTEETTAPPAEEESAPGKDKGEDS